MTIPGEILNARSWLFAPGDSERKMEKAAAGATDIVLFDLEDAVAVAREVLDHDRRLVRRLGED